MGIDFNNVWRKSHNRYITKEKNSIGFNECKKSAKEGGKTANEAKKSIEKRLRRTIISNKNFLIKNKKNN